MVCFLLIIIESFKARSGSFVPVKRRFAFSFDVLLFFSFHFSLFTYLKVNDVGQRLFFYFRLTWQKFSRDLFMNKIRIICGSRFCNKISSGILIFVRRCCSRLDRSQIVDASDILDIQRKRRKMSTWTVITVITMTTI